MVLAFQEAPMMPVPGKKLALPSDTNRYPDAKYDGSNSYDDRNEVRCDFVRYVLDFRL